jgi:succinate-semialdehyde dehydrogenase / glutarate-semialdehyde dehydrogenase
MTKLISINPATEKKIGEVDNSSQKEINNKVSKSKAAFENWGKLKLNIRIGHLKKVVKEIEKNKKHLSEMATNEMGMPISDSKCDVDDAIHYFNWYLTNAEKYLSPEVLHEDSNFIHTVYHEPIGVQASITPWNYPASNAIWGFAQSLVCGNTVVHKTSEECPLFGKLIEKIFTKHLPDGVFNEVYGAGDVGKELVNGNIDLISFTGSTKTGKYLYKVAAKKFIKIILELGGSAPGIVFDDADLEQAVDNVFFNRYGNCGQTCDGLKRLIVHEEIADQFIDLLLKKTSKVKVGKPQDEKTQMGPLISEKQLNTLIKQVADAKNKGAKILTGGKKIDSEGFYFEPTVLINVKQNMLVWKEEVFGPVLPVVTFKKNEEAVNLANDTKYGLGSYIYTADKDRGMRVASGLHTGMVSVNSVSYVQPFNPFGGCKMSGMGSEHGKFGFQDLTQIKIVSSDK